MKCQIQFSGGKSEKNTINLSSAEFAQRVVKFNIWCRITLKSSVFERNGKERNRFMFQR